MRTTNSQLSQWETMISDAKASGLSRKAWCEAHGISVLSREFHQASTPLQYQEAALKLMTLKSEQITKLRIKVYRQ